MVHACNNSVWLALENHLVPPPASTNWYYSTVLKNSVVAVCLLPVGIVTGGFVGLQKACSFTASFWTKRETIDPKKDFSAVLEDSRLWEQLGDIEKSLIDKPLDLHLMGPATCTYQDSGRKVCFNSQWATWEDICIKDPKNRSGNTPSLFELYTTPHGRQEVIERLQKLNANAFRFSIEWSQVEPYQGVWISSRMQVYIDLCKDLRDAGIEVMVTLHHFSEPKWFHDLGSFEKEENVGYFASFAAEVCRDLTQKYKGHSLVNYFCTINEPAIEAFSRYVLGSFSPGCFLKFERAGNFLKNALKAHTAVYDIFKKNTPLVQVGIVHQYLKFIPTNFLLIPVVRYLTQLINEVPLNFFKNNGNFELKIPFLCNLEERCTKPMTDFVGLQYYARPVIGLTGPTSFHEPMTKMPFREDPAGLYEATIETYEAFRVPVIITENGISTDENAQRSRYMTRALYAVREAAQRIGKENIWGYFPWSLGDNLEWNMGMKPQAFGAYALTAEGLAKDPKPGMLAYTRVAAAWLSWQKKNEKIA